MSLFELIGAREYFAHLEKKYPAGTLLDSGKLYPADGWGNVREHCLIQAAAWEVFGPMLGLSKQEVYTLASTAICHNWRKRLEKKPGDFQENEKLLAERVFEQMVFDYHVNRRLFDCLTPRFNLRALSGKAGLLELLQWYIDDIAKDGELVTFEKRISEVEARNPDPDPEMMPELAKLGFDNYWVSERVIGIRVGQMIAAMLRARMIRISSPDQISEMINAEIEHRILG